ncbi:Uri superfamily endonuclease [Azospirillum fermentarium]|uniref:GIY-YIG nuclease family protein n=1 Tax=Azospirillum fermentarium TaxID=1233114 RepID=UPI002226D459|nr:GIY-YIG nuclease family protein [Azospirillum fermentarium]MCW2247758.1 Uri superfamily endonuclease [Azospirillum fermentarium]
MMSRQASQFHCTAETLPPVAGAYVLLVRLTEAVDVTLPGRTKAILPPGRYLYCGSAHGPGGLRARVGRHMRRDKSIRWHIDRLTAAGTVTGCWIFPAGDECALVARLATLSVPVPGFGSSDCTVCRSHLLAWPGGVALPFDVADVSPATAGPDIVRVLSVAAMTDTVDFTPAERDLIRREFMSRWSEPPRLADGILLKRWATGPQKGEPKLTAIVQSLLERGLVTIAETDRGFPHAHFTPSGYAALQAMAASQRHLPPERYGHLIDELARRPEDR